MELKIGDKFKTQLDNKIIILSFTKFKLLEEKYNMVIFKYNDEIRDNRTSIQEFKRHIKNKILTKI